MTPRQALRKLESITERVRDQTKRTEELYQSEILYGPLQQRLRNIFERMAAETQEIERLWVDLEEEIIDFERSQ